MDSSKLSSGEDTWHGVTLIHMYKHTNMNKNKIKVSYDGLEDCSTVNRAAVKGVLVQVLHPHKGLQLSVTLVLEHLMLFSGFHVLTSHAHGADIHSGKTLMYIK